MEQELPRKLEKTCGVCKRRIIIMSAVFFALVIIAIWMLINSYHAYGG